MAVTKTSRLGLDKFGDPTDQFVGRAGWNTHMDRLDALLAIAVQGTIGNRPAAGVTGRVFFDTTTSRFYYDTGQAWIEISPVGGGGAPKPAGADAVEGLSRIAARADHVHPRIPAGFGAVEMSSANAQGIPDNAWRACNWSSTDYIEGAGLGARTEGVSISQTGRYLVIAWVVFDNYGSGRRAIGIGAASGGGPSGITSVVPNAPANKTQPVHVTDEVSFTAGQVVTAWVYQDSGVPINISDRRLKVRRVG